MKIPNLAIVLFCMFSTMSFSASADTQQKMIVIKDQNSYLMDGDPYANSANKPLNYRADEVLPSLLSIGWRITGIYINEKSLEDSLYGYLLIERTIE